MRRYLGFCLSHEIKTNKKDSEGSSKTILTWNYLIPGRLQQYKTLKIIIIKRSILHSHSLPYSINAPSPDTIYHLVAPGHLTLNLQYFRFPPVFFSCLQFLTISNMFNINWRQGIV